ncbi:MAG TPA: ATPase [Ruminiclostridium sp.]|jgi:cell division septum initiation protein DivIVA|nr:ATPase [Candidatus Epulonipiscium sp.]HAA42890.1 ATPase [Ruminiclostridium sp.]HOQ15925.1 ATPase [Defluviitaleaceae bacterium]HPT76149.1 ATPase [Defluviitaleaceae bacterium]HQD50072.1 ATPase [Defluviitaleaceae bacterium]
MDSILQLLEAIEDMLDSSSAVPFTGKVMIDKDELYEIITDIRLKLPNEIKQSKWVIEERNKILIDAQKEAENTLKEADAKLAKLVDEHEITKRAYEQAEEIIEAAKQNAREMRLGALDYADEILAEVEKSLKQALEVIHNQNMELEDSLGRVINTIYTNRQELKGNAQK